MEQKIGFALKGLKTEQFATFNENLSNDSRSGINVSVDFRINKELRRLGAYATFDFKQNQKPIIKLQISCHFEIAPDSWEKYSSDSKMIMPKKFLQHIAVLTIGTARGVLHSKTEGSEFNKFMLPTIDVTQIVNSDAEFDI